jgi:hypothetical protein
MLTLAALLIAWRGNNSIWQSLLIFPGGLATGIVHSAVFIGLTSGVAEDEIAIAGSGLYTSGNIGGVAGVSGADAVFQHFLRSGLDNSLSQWPDGPAVSLSRLRCWINE